MKQKIHETKWYVIYTVKNKFLKIVQYALNVELLTSIQQTMSKQKLKIKHH